MSLLTECNFASKANLKTLKLIGVIAGQSNYCLLRYDGKWCFGQGFPEIKLWTVFAGGDLLPSLSSVDETALIQAGLPAQLFWPLLPGEGVELCVTPRSDGAKQIFFHFCTSAEMESKKPCVRHKAQGQNETVV